MGDDTDYKPTLDLRWAMNDGTRELQRLWRTADGQSEWRRYEAFDG